MDGLYYDHCVLFATEPARDGIKNLLIGGAATDSKGLFRGVTVGGPNQPLEGGGGAHFLYCFKQTIKTSHFYNDTSVQQVICKAVKNHPQDSMSVLTKKKLPQCLVHCGVKGLLIVFDFITSKSTLLFCPASMALMNGIFNLCLEPFHKNKNSLTISCIRGQHKP